MYENSVHLRSFTSPPLDEWVEKKNIEQKINWLFFSYAKTLNAHMYLILFFLQKKKTLKKSSVFFFRRAKGAVVEGGLTQFFAYAKWVAFCQRERERERVYWHSTIHVKVVQINAFGCDCENVLIAYEEVKKRHSLSLTHSLAMRFWESLSYSPTIAASSPCDWTLITWEFLSL